MRSRLLDLIAAHAAARLRTSRELKTELAGTRLAKWFVALAMPGDLFHHVRDECRLLRSSYREQPLGWIVLGVAGCSEAFGLFALPAHHGDGSGAEGDRAERARRFARCLVLGAIGGLAAYEAFSTRLRASRVVAPSSASASKDGMHRAGARRGFVVQPRGFHGAFAAFSINAFRSPRRRRIEPRSV